MLCQVRTIGAGIGVLAVCFMLASLSWQNLLLGFALASIAWAGWSCSVQLRPRKNDKQLPPPLEFDPTRRRRDPSGNIYSFPTADWGNQSSYN